MAAEPEIQQSARAGEFGTGFDEESLRRGIEMVPSCDVGTSLMRRWKPGEAGAHRGGAAIISAIVDVRRIGYRGDLTSGDVRALYRHYLPGEAADPRRWTRGVHRRDHRRLIRRSQVRILQGALLHLRKLQPRPRAGTAWGKYEAKLTQPPSGLYRFKTHPHGLSWRFFGSGSPHCAYRTLLVNSFQAVRAGSSRAR
ncbi:hypothetical protein GCM10010412_099710 [Nonomuraea recticatena]|uniref:Uncharacterized protein n=1 Tax=Nonomuraea recticatena TaxID=46178 RepID=A0ABP6FVB9_9ACTN